MGKRKERKIEIRREKYERSYQIPDCPSREDYSTQREYLIDLQEYNIQRGHFYNCVDGEPLDPDPRAIQTFRRIMNEMSPDDVEGWRIYLDMEGDMVCVEPTDRVCFNNTYYHVSANIYEGEILIYDYKDTRDCWKEGASNPWRGALSIPKLKEWMKAMTAKYNITPLHG